MAVNKELLRKIPKMDELLALPQLEDAAQIYGPAAVTAAARSVLETLRADILAGVRPGVPPRSEIAQLVQAQAAQAAQPSLRRVVNATGVVLHTNLGRAPLAAAAIQCVAQVAGQYSTLEFDAQAGTRGSRHSHVRELLCSLTGAEDAMVVNNNAAAVLLVLGSLAKGRQSVISRGELIEIGGSFRIPEIMELSGSALRAVGATNRTRLADYENAIDPEQTGVLLKAHTSNYKIVGFTEEVDLAALVALGQKHGLPVVYDLGSGSLLPLRAMGFEDEPHVQACVATGADIVCFSGDKLLGGPQAGIVLGKKKYIDVLKKNPFARAVRIDKLTLAALEATLRLYGDTERAAREIPALAMLLAGKDELRKKARRLARRLAPVKSEIAVVDEDDQVGGGSLPTRVLPGAAVRIAPRTVPVMELERRLRTGALPIVGHISRDTLLLHVRCMDEKDFAQVADAVIEALRP